MRYERKSMKENKFLVFSDLHFEKRPDAHQKHLAAVINKKIEDDKKNGFNPIVLLAGDINNGDLAYDWISSLNAQVFYTAGNHEFWDCDFYDALEKLKNNAPSNTKFLYNDFEVLDDNTVILGCTLWTDVGQNIKPSLVAEAAHSMNDSSYIKASKWYESEENVAKLKSLINDYAFNIFEKSKRWNVLIELEENKKSLDFLNNFAVVLNMLEKIESKVKGKSYESTQVIDAVKSFWGNLKKQDCDYSVYLQSIVSIKNTIPYSFISDYEFEIAKSEDAFKVFKKLIKHKNFMGMKVVLMTHHLPFYEEIVIGRYEYSSHENQKTLGKFDYKLFLTREGVDYEKHNYLYRLSKGDFDSSDSIFHIAHYFNNGHVKFSEQLKKRVGVFVHGHHHLFNYQDYLKGKLVVTNTGANGFFHRYKYDESGVPSLIKSSLTDEQVAKESIREFNLNSDLSYRAEKAMLWCLKNTDFTGLKNLVSLGLETSKTMYKLALKNKCEDITENTEFMIYQSAMTKILEDIGQIVIDFKLSLDARLNDDFTMNTYIGFKSETKEKMDYEANYLEKKLLGTHLHRSLSSLRMFSDTDYLPQSTFELYEVFKIISANALKIKDMLDMSNITDPNSISEEDVLIYESLMKKMKKDSYFYEKISSKWEKEKMKKESTKDLPTYRTSISSFM